jgi:hypothetical protein
MQLRNYGSVIMKRCEENQALHRWVKMMEFQDFVSWMGVKWVKLTAKQKFTVRKAP